MWTVLFVASCVLLILAIAINRDFFSPSAILCETYILAIVCAMYMKETWGFSIHGQTVSMIILGNIVFLVVSLYCRSFKYKKSLTSEVTQTEINYCKGSLVIVIFLCVVIFAIYTYLYLRMFGGLGFSTLSSMTKYYRFHTDDLADNMPSIVNQSLKLLRAAAYVCLYVYIHNFVVKRKEIKDVKLLIPVACYIPTTIFAAARFDLIIFLLYGIVLWIFFQRRYFGSRKFQMKNYIKIIGVFAIVVFIFSSSRSLVGRTNTLDLFSYVSSYFGGSVQCFDVYLLKNSVAKCSDYFGQELFSGIYKLLAQFKLISEREGSESLGSFITVNSIVVGNVYTAYRKMIHDFGAWGVIIFQGMLSLIMNKLYVKAKYSIPQNLPASLILYATLTFVLYLHPFSEFFFSTVLSWNYFLFFVCIWFIKKLLIDVRIKFGRLG